MTKRTIFTTGQIAKLCGVAMRTVSKWIDVGLLPGYRLPGGCDRRVVRAKLEKFMREELELDLVAREKALRREVLKAERREQERQERERTECEQINPLAAPLEADAQPVAQ